MFDTSYKLCDTNIWRYVPYSPVDGIYTSWAIFVKPINKPDNAAQEYYIKRQDVTMKDIEICFGVLYAPFRFL